MIKNVNYKLGLIILFNIIFAAFYFLQKQAYHIDEIFSFAHANSTHGAYLTTGIDSFLDDSDNKIFHHKLNGDYFASYINPDYSQGLSYWHIVDNLKVGVHPPLYYFLLHTASYLSGGADKWVAFSINAIFLSLLLTVVYKLAQKIFTDERMCYLGVIFCGFSLTTFNMTIFIRSYLLQMLLTAWLIYEHVKLLEKDNVTYKDMLPVFIAALLGFFTHYFLLLSTFIIAAVACCILLLRKKYKILFMYIGTMLLSVLCFFVIWYPAFEVLTGSSRSQQFTEKTADWYFLYTDLLLNRFYTIIMTKIFSFNQPYMLISSLVAVGAVCFIWLRSMPINSVAKQMLYFSLPYCLLITFISPDMKIYDERYFAAFVPILSLLILYGADLLLQALKITSAKLRFVIMLLIVAANIAYTDYSHRSAYLFKCSDTISALTIKLAGAKIIFYGDLSFLMNLAPVFAKADYVKAYYLLEPKLLTEAVQTREEEYLIADNTSQTSSINCSLNKPIPLPEKASEFLTYQNTFNYGIYQYDLYKINR